MSIKKTIFDQFYEVVRSEFKSDAELAYKLGITRGAFGKYTRNNNPVSPKISTIEKWCENLGFEISNNIFKKKVI